jgi:hypothetical protein
MRFAGGKKWTYYFVNHGISFGDDVLQRLCLSEPIKQGQILLSVCIAGRMWNQHVKVSRL